MKSMPSKAIASLLVCSFAVLVNGTQLLAYTNQEKGYSIEFPNTWEVVEGIMGRDVFALSPPSSPADDFRENVNVMVDKLPEKVNLSGYYDLAIVALKKLPGFKLLETKDIEIAGLPGKKIKFQFDQHTTTNHGVIVSQYMIIKNQETLILITAVMADKEQTVYEPLIDQIANSLNL